VEHDRRLGSGAFCFLDHLFSGKEIKSQVLKPKHKIPFGLEFPSV
jgi:hypothetical protein